MPVKSPAVFPAAIEALEARQLLSTTISITQFGAVANDKGDDTNAITAALRAASPGDTVSVPSGVFNLSGLIVLRSGITLQGTSGSALDFAVSRSGYAIQIAGNSSDVKVDGLIIRSNDGIFDMTKGSGYTNISITNDDFQWGYDGSYYHRLAVNDTVANTNLQITHNYFHDSPNSDRNVELWYSTNLQYSYNKFYDINDGGHIMEPGDNDSFSYNVGRLIHRSGIEIQQVKYLPTHVTQNLTVQGNVFYDWNLPYYDSFGASVPIYGNGTKIIDNYFRQNAWQGIFGQKDNGGVSRGSYGIEAPQGTNNIIRNNYIGGDRVATSVSEPGQSTLVTGNFFYGSKPLFGDYVTTEPGGAGLGKVVQSNNTIDTNLAHMPDPSTLAIVPTGNDSFPFPVGGTGTDGSDGTGGSSGVGPAGLAPYLKAYVNDATRITLSWIDGTTDEDGFRVERTQDPTSNNWATVFDSRAANVTGYQDKSLPAGTQFWYRVVPYKNGVTGVYSNIVAPTTKGTAASKTQTLAIAKAKPLSFATTKPAGILASPLNSKPDSTLFSSELI